MMVKLNQSDLDEINKTFKKLADIDKNPIFGEFAIFVYQRAHSRADKHTKTGAMINALFIENKADTYTIGVSTRLAPYALFVHWGSKPHEIKPKKRKVLRFVGKDGRFVQFWGPKTKQEKAKILAWREKKGIKDRFIFKWVSHPGYKGDPFLTLALDDGLKKLPQFFERLTKDL